MPEPSFYCLRCGSSRLKVFGHIIEVWKFSTMLDYQAWSEWGNETFYRNYYIHDIVKVFPRYDTLQWDNLFEDYY